MEANDKFLNKLSRSDLYLVAYAVLEHRASFKGEFYSKLSEIISSADRGEPNLEDVILRSLKFNKGNADEVYEHIKSKYKTGGYGRYPKLYNEFFANKIKEFKTKVDNLKIEDINRYLNND